jgi:protein-L-isoaspartate O-methyltransferase
MTHDDRDPGQDDRALLAHYLERGHEPWNVSTEAAWLDFALRTYVEPRLPTHRPLAVCNVGIGVGLWDDWLGHLTASSITSVDRDPDICRIFEQRQQAERHPHPAQVVCGDVLHGILGAQRFDLITCVGSTLTESGDGAQVERILAQALAPEGRLITADVLSGTATIALVLTSTNASGRPMEPVMKAELTRCACTRINDPWRRFCGGCGKHLQPSCRCGFVNSPNDLFCGGCGDRVALASRAKNEQVTIPLEIFEVIS